MKKILLNENTTGDMPSKRCYNGDRDDIIHYGNSKNVIINIIVIIISAIINIISF